MSKRGREFAEKWADENIQLTASPTQEFVGAVTQRMLIAATEAGLPTDEITYEFTSLSEFVAIRMGSDSSPPSEDDLNA